MSEELIKKWRRELDVVKDANLWDTEAELAWLAEQASKATRILELGSFRGASTKIMALANPAAKIVVIDAWHDPGTKESFDKLLEGELAEHRVYPIHANTTDGFNNIPEGFEPDFTFIDAGHLYPDVEHDIRRTLEIQKQGVISGHDYRHDIPGDGVNKAVHEAFPLGVDFPADSIWAYELA